MERVKNSKTTATPAAQSFVTLRPYMHPKQLQIKDFTYELPAEKIARYPLPIRDESRLLVYRDGDISETQYKNIAQHLPAQSLLVFNNTKVVEARLLFEKETGGIIELFCLEPGDEYEDITTAMLQRHQVRWKCLVGGAKKWKTGKLYKHIDTPTGALQLSAEKISQQSDYFIIKLAWDDNGLSFAEVLHYAGVIPLPPYLNRTAEEQDKSTYQTVYARHDGSVAAPTAGLHFSPRIFDSFTEKDINSAFVTLHVGAGTFKPVKAATMQEHEMHAEFIDVDRAFITTLINHSPKPVITVGTTSLRTIESLYWMGVKLLGLEQKKSLTEVGIQDISIYQWDAYELPQDVTLKDSLTALLGWMTATGRGKLITKTQIIIAPGYTLKVADGLVTNFHQPQSTLLLLVAAVIGCDWRKVYQYALDNNFRFLSYGDGSLLFKR